MSARLTVNGEHGATATRVIASKEGSWWASTAASVAASASCVDSVTASGGRPPAERPRSIDPRAGSSRIPTARAASTSAAAVAAGSRGNT
ncbi:hypothetical protein HNR25_004913 [Streptomonospora salina]|uniref:Uncharacterized protein n=1 Tax=Streptomonospora salina TaxID=104205 RepID=A0A841EFJ7_9ACTN|nr:hypothetical protein [Streptomonospora salina]